MHKNWQWLQSEEDIPAFSMVGNIAEIWEFIHVAIVFFFLCNEWEAKVRIGV